MRLDFLRYPEHLGPHLVEASPYLYNRIYKGEAPTRQRYKVRKVSLYDELVTSLCIEVAYGVHRMAKTGAIKLSEIMIPRADRNDLSSLLATSVTNKEENMNGLQSVVILRPTKDNVVHILYQKKLSRNHSKSRWKQQNLESLQLQWSQEMHLIIHLITGVGLYQKNPK